MDNQNKMELIDKILTILEGIDKTEINSDKGWWETSEGAIFGQNILSKINDLKIVKGK